MRFEAVRSSALLGLILPYVVLLTLVPPLKRKGPNIYCFLLLPLSFIDIFRLGTLVALMALFTVKHGDVERVSGFFHYRVLLNEFYVF